jgi:hypothetical protein
MAIGQGATPSYRNQWLDFFRGLALIFIVVDHISNSPSSFLTLRNYALCDASEVFVFISGIAATLAFRRTAQKSGFQSACWRMFCRSGKLYAVYLGAALALTLLCVMLNSWGWSYNAVWPGHATQFLNSPLLYLFHVAVFYLQPALSNILPLYVVLMLVAPFLIYSMERLPVSILALSLLVWRCAPFLNSLLPSDTGDGYFFDPFAWQLMFVLGIVFGLWGPIILAHLDCRPVLMTWIAGIVAALAAMQAWIWHVPEIFAVFPPEQVKDWLYPISKTHLDLCRIISFLAIAWLTRMSLRDVQVNWSRKPITFITLVGRNGLPCFTLGIVVSLLGDAIALNVTWMSSLLEGTLIDLAAAGAMIATAYLSETWTQLRRHAVDIRTQGHTAVG